MHYTALQVTSAHHLERFLGQIASLPGFVCIGTPPSRTKALRGQWLAAKPIQFLCLAGESRASLARKVLLAMAPLHECTRLAGILDYDAGYSLEPAIRQWHSPGSRQPIRIGVYAWWLEPDLTANGLRLCRTPDCPAGIEQEILSLLQASKAANGQGLPQFSVKTFRADLSREQYVDAVYKVQHYIQNGDIYQANLSQRFESTYTGSLWQAFSQLCKKFPSPHCGYLKLGTETVLSISPESFLEINKGSVRTQPIKGTRPRGRTAHEDQLQAEKLKASAKDRAENIMIVDLLRNDLGRVSETGSVVVESLAELHSFVNVHHLVSTVSSRLKAGIHPFEALLWCFPGGSITGAPKIRAMEIIAELEVSPRGPYCGSLFWLNGEGKLYSNIAIRTLYARDEKLYCHGGGGVVADSSPAGEYQETLDKVGPLMQELSGNAQILAPADP